MRSKKKTTHAAVSHSQNDSQLCLEGDNLTSFLKAIQREIQSVGAGETSLPPKFLIKQQFAVGVNEVTRVLERMPLPRVDLASSDERIDDKKFDSVPLQAILLARDCNPRLITKHLTSLAASRNVPIILVKDCSSSNNINKGSCRLGDLVKLRTAISIGIKAKGSSVNNLIKEFLSDNKIL